jgi:Tol biopolymer transport system component
MRLPSSYPRSLLAAACVALSGACVPAAQAAYPGRNGPLVFTERPKQRGATSVWKADRDGHQHRSLIAGEPDLMFGEANGGAQWSPDGRRIAFTHVDPGSFTTPARYDIWTMDGDGSHVRHLTSAATGTGFTQPTWSPDGKRIAYVSNGIGVMNADGSEPKTITDPTDWAPVWSPDGQRIAFARATAEQGPDIWTVRPDGSDAIPLTSDKVYDTDPSWSPDSKQIAFAREAIDRADDPNHGFDLWVMRADGSHAHRLFDGGARGMWDPAWSPNGRQIAYVDKRHRNSDIWVTDPSGKHRHVLVAAENHGFSEPDWQPLPG